MNVAFQTEHDALAHSGDRSDRPARAFADRRIEGAEEKRAREPHGPKRLRKRPPPQMVDVDFDVGELGHELT